MDAEHEPHTALVVDDDSGTRTMLRLILELEGWRVLEAEDGREALAALGSNGSRPDVVITDIEMPGMNGLEFAARLREEKEGLPLLAVTRYPLKGADSMLFDKVLRKPVSVSALREWLIRH
jgi:CheY-like chemotaxis protein